MPVDVTVITATHRRPDALRAAVASVRAQTHGDWRLLVLGDGCDADTSETVAAFDDERIEYIDLPARFGEQAGPNSVGLALADAPYVAFLNHDDVWLPDHLERSLPAMRVGDFGFFIARSAHARETVAGPDGAPRPAFEELRPASHDPLDAVDGRVLVFEPCSAWIVRRDVALRIGPWRPARTLHRTPLVDWFLRAVRQRARFGFGDVVTVLSVATHTAPGRAGAYAPPSPEFAALTAWLASTTPDEARAEILAQVAERGPTQADPRSQRPWRRYVSGPVRRLVFRTTGVDLRHLLRSVRGRRRGAFLDRLARERTGAGLPEPPALDEVIAQVRRRRTR